MSRTQVLGLIGIVEDDSGMRQGLSWLLAAARFNVVVFASAEEFLQHTRDAEFDCLILDVRLPGMDGLALRKMLRERGRQMPILLMSGHDDAAMREQFRRAGVGQWLRKPFDGQALLDAVHAAVGGGA